MDVALVAYIGSGLALWSSGVDGDIPDDMFTNGVDVVRGLAQHGDRAGVEGLVAGVVGEIWQEWRNSRRKRQVLVSHLEHLPELIAAHRPSSSTITSAIAEARRIRRNGGSVELVAHRVASDIILGARTTGELTARELDETLCFFLLSRLMSSLLARNDTLLAMRAAFDATFGRAPRAAANGNAAETSESLPPPATSAVQPVQADAVSSDSVAANCSSNIIDGTVAHVAETFVVPVQALQFASSRMAALGGGMPGAEELEETASLLADLATRIAAAPPEALLAVVAEALERGAITEIDDLLADGEAAASHANTVPLDETARAAMNFETVQCTFTQPMAWRIMRAQFAELTSEWLSAARHFAYARTMVPPGARQLCGPLLKRQAGALVSHGIHHHEEKVLIEAAQVYAEAGGFLSETQAPLEWAQAHVDLGHLMLVLGEREIRPERFLAAALHFKPAVDVFSRLHELDRWAQAQIGLAHALKRTGEFQGDVVTLGDAAFAFRAALGRLTKDRSPQDWADAQLGLGETLVRIAEETGEPETLAKAVPALKAALAQPRETVPSLDVTSAQAALGRAYVSLDAHQQDDILLQDAISLLESALASGSRALSHSELAVIEQVRGTALWSLGERRSSLHMLEDAMRAKLNAVELHEQLGELGVAGRLREDLDDLSSAIERMAHRGQRGALNPEYEDARSA